MLWKRNALLFGGGVMMAALQAVPAWRVKLWNKKEKKKPVVFLTSLFLFFLLLLLFCIAEIPIFSFIRNFIGLSMKEESNGYSMGLFVKLLCMILSLAACSLYFSLLILNILDRGLTRKQEITLIQCHATRIGKFYKWYYLEGIYNGRHYHFKMTRKMYLLLKRQPAVAMTARRGIFGGIYVIKPPERKGS